MDAPQRYAGQGPGSVVPAEAGDLVRFADVEEALRDRERLAWVLPIIDGCDDDDANRRTAALAAGLQAGLTGIALVDQARRICS